MTKKITGHPNKRPSTTQLWYVQGIAAAANLLRRTPLKAQSQRKLPTKQPLTFSKGKKGELKGKQSRKKNPTTAESKHYSPVKRAFEKVKSRVWDKKGRGRHISPKIRNLKSFCPRRGTGKGRTDSELTSQTRKPALL